MSFFDQIEASRDDAQEFFVEAASALLCVIGILWLAALVTAPLWNKAPLNAPWISGAFGYG